MENLGWSRRDFLKRSVLASGLVVAGPGLVTACQRTEPGTGQATGSTLQRIRDEGTVTVGFANEEPYAYRGEGGQLLGEAPAIHGYIFEQIGGITLEGELFDFDALIPALNAGRVDVVTAGMFITPERCRQAAFSNPEYVVGTSLLVESGNPMGLSDYDSVAQKGAKLAVLSGAVELEQATGAGVKQSQLLVVADQTSGLDAVKAGRADALALTSPSLRAAAEGESAVEVVEPPFTPVIDGEEQIGAGAAVFRQEDTELVNAFNKELAALVKSPRWVQLVRPFGFSESERPPANLTADELCKG
jgi:polar amino acid transport system substrate-binding protein